MTDAAHQRVLDGLDLPRDGPTDRRLTILVQQLSRWTPRINLVASSTLATVWTRHIEDSAQLLAHAPMAATRWTDLGSGGGFPGLVIAALAAELRPELHVRLVESDLRKGAFLAATAREMDVDVEIALLRAETLPREPVDVLSARAFAPLPRLLDIAEPIIGSSTIAILPKGANWRAELTEARRHWHMKIDVRPSATHAEAVVLILTEIARVP